MQIKDILIDKDPHALLDLAANLGVHMHHEHNGEIIADKIKEALEKDATALAKMYSKETVEALISLSVNDKLKMQETFEVLIKDGFAIEKNSYCYISDELKDIVKNGLTSKEAEDLIDKCEECENITSGIILNYGVIEFEEMFNIYIEASDDIMSLEEYIKFIMHRTSLLERFDIIQKDDSLYYFVEEIDEVLEAIEAIESNAAYEYKVLSREDYLNINDGIYEFVDAPSLKHFEALLAKYELDNEMADDIIKTVILDIKLGLESELIYDVMTYVIFENDEEESEMKSVLKEVYDKTEKWINKGNI